MKCLTHAKLSNVVSEQFCKVGMSIFLPSLTKPRTGKPKKNSQSDFYSFAFNYHYDSSVPPSFSLRGWGWGFFSIPQKKVYLHVKEQNFFGVSLSTYLYILYNSKRTAKYSNVPQCAAMRYRLRLAHDIYPPTLGMSETMHQSPAPASAVHNPLFITTTLLPIHSGITVLLGDNLTKSSDIKEIKGGYPTK